MNILQFIFYLGVINIIFGFIWKWVFVLPTAIFFAVIKFNDGMKLVKIFGAYLLVSLTAVLTLKALGNSPNSFSLLFYPVLGAFVVFIGFANNTYQAQQQARTNMDWELMRDLERNAPFDFILMCSAVVLYVITLFIPQIAINMLTLWLFSVVAWALNLPIIGWLIGLGGVLFLLNILFYGLIASGFIISSIFNKLKKQPSLEPPKKSVGADA